MPNPMTVKGAESLREELAHRKGALRQEIAEAIAEARAHGDLKENAEYHAAREQQSFNEGRAQEIEARLADAQIIDHFRPVGRLAGTVAYRVHAAENEVMPYSFSILSVLKLGV